ncbi:WD40-repeat-containing domain [Pseudocohnilembus persalinus]|uniref:WD40-repeat-containing domain n=1 Tax=Pseudocohnilembus persalinus TaxID=266149 RepID=A0A0V0R0G3_PSEPJ|nr:WD40-repeat-containing domain [Pseudocohnilembus persalinus]|eukprot:KRX08018.1 WD40-repeat-containing domain [Pseudocohnilembus persalinus]
MANFSPISNNYAVTCGTDKMMYVYDTSNIQSPQLIYTYDFSSTIVTSCSISNDEQKILATREDGYAQIFSISTKQSLYLYSKHSTKVWYGAFSPDNLYIVTSGQDQTVRVWEVVSQTQIYKLQGHSGNVYSASFSQDQTMIISAGEDSFIKIWSMADGSLLSTFSVHAQAVYYAGFSADDSLIISCSLDETVKITDFNTQVVQIDFMGHSSGILSAKLSQDQLIACSVSLDGETLIWSAQDGSIIDEYYNHSGKTISSIDFSYDSAYIITAGVSNLAVITQIGCVYGQYYDNDTLKCESCSYKCVTCSSFSVCTECVVGYYRKTTIPDCECFDNYFESAYEQPDCKSCRSPCKTCISLSQCETCLSGYYYNEDSTSKCSACVSPCKTCSDSTTCISCISGKHRKGIEQNCVCQHGYEESSESSDCVKVQKDKFFGNIKEEQERLEEDEDEEEIIEFEKNKNKNKSSEQDYQIIQKNTSFKPNQKQLRKKLGLEDPEQDNLNSQQRLITGNNKNKQKQNKEYGLEDNNQKTLNTKRIKRQRQNELIIQEQMQENKRYANRDTMEDLETISINSNIMQSTLKSFKGDQSMIKKE